ncbi:hypothetical protein GOBAR_AA08648 [Gossypium barbadense]|uniref:Uncharacterized protein n=1 Tax=Gossypium barbadense TaxID=3634 RepID=A0A2P5Y8S1_GOSBA|nr:hypothetical protein GOBAR_AA08648 [Gossypium barbadense]
MNPMNLSRRRSPLALPFNKLHSRTSLRNHLQVSFRHIDTYFTLDSTRVYTVLCICNLAGESRPIRLACELTKIRPKPIQRRKSKNIRKRMKRLRSDMQEISREQGKIKEGQRQVREKFEAVESECELLRKETNIIMQQSMSTQLRLAFMFQILKARENHDLDQAAKLTSALRLFSTHNS